MTQKKTLILVMSCNKPDYNEKEQIVRDTWAKDVLDGKYPETELWFFKALTDETRKSAGKDIVSDGVSDAWFDNTTHTIYVSASDLRDRTFQKLMKSVLQMINSKKHILSDFDCLVRVNISTYMNMPLLFKFTSSIDLSDNSIFSGCLCNSPWFRPFGLPFVMGEYIIMNRKVVDGLIKEYLANRVNYDNMEKDASDANRFLNDDGCMTAIWFKQHRENYFSDIHSTGIIHECHGEGLQHTDLYHDYMGINFKTTHIDGIDNIPLVEQDKHDHFLEIERNKAEKIHMICSDYKTDEAYLDEWLVRMTFYIEDTTCYTADEVRNPDGKVDFNHRVPKRDIIKAFDPNITY